MTTASPGQSSATGCLAAVAQGFGFTVWPARNIKDPFFPAAVRAGRIDILINVHSLHIIPVEVLRAVRIGAFNMHPGPLPQYAGLNTVSWAIYEGETSYGVTVHWIAADVDAGNIAYKAT